jgi:hypothetical protein
VVYRISFGLIMLWEVYRYFDRGWVRHYYIEPEFMFKYFGFSWVTPWPPTVSAAASPRET